MSYAAAAAKNRLPEDQQPHPDPNLLEGGSHSSDSESLSHSGTSDEKVHIVTREEFEEETHPVTEDQQASPPRFTAEDAAPSAEETARKAQADVEKVEQKGKQVKQDVKEKAGKEADKAEKKWDKAASVAKEEYEDLSEKAKAAYNKMSKEARDDWHKLSKESKKRWSEAKNSEAGKELQKPEVWGSILGVTNLAVLGGVAYFTYTNWGKPRWDRRVVSATVIGLGTWFGLQGWLIPQSDAVKQRRA